MKRPDRSLTEPPDLPHSEVEGFALDGEYDFASPTNKEGIFRSARILASVKLSTEVARRALALLHNPKTYGGEPERCFIPRHGLRFLDSSRSVDVLFCLECHWVYFFYDTKIVKATLSEPSERWLQRFFDDVLQMPNQPPQTIRTFGPPV